MSEVQSYRQFKVKLARKTAVSPSLLSLVFSGPDVAQMKCDSPDQRIKILFPSEDGTPPSLPAEGPWHQLALAIPKAQRPIIRTYTLRHVDPQRQEVTVEFVNHGIAGPGSAWAINAVPGDAVQIVAPDAAYPHDSGGYEWAPPEGLRRALIIADETALPAARGILEMLATQAKPPEIQAFFEVPQEADCVNLHEFPFADIIWLPRDVTGAVYGECLLQAVKERVRVPESHHQGVLKEEAEGELLWDKASSRNNDFYGWIAAESTVVKRLRRYLIGERGVEHKTINFMAYWAKGHTR